MNALKNKWHKDLIKDDIREQDMDEKRLNERCYYRIQYEPYSWCDLSDNICVMDTGNSLFNVECDVYSDFLEESDERITNREKS